MSVTRALIFLCIVVCPVGRAAAREWSSTDGKHRQEAELVTFQDNFAWLKTPDGRFKRIAVDQLSAADKQYVKQWEFNKKEFENLQANPPELEGGSVFVSVASSELVTSAKAATATKQEARTANYKRIFSGGCVTLHLIHDPAFEWTSTAAYRMNHQTKHGWRCVQYLANLKYNRRDLGFMYWTPKDGDAFTGTWAISLTPDCCGCYRIYARGRGNWQLIDHVYMSVPK